MRHLVVGTAGHIDHGKTALVKALTGVDTDRLKEEKERGITIDIGFASLALDGETSVGFVDVPGHERFVKNMLAGVGGIDLVMLVIAADESVMPQTREHLDICSLLHVKQGLTVITKVDAADRELADLAEIEAHELLRGTFLETAPVVRVSARTGEGIPALLELLRQQVRSVRPKDATRTFRLPVDRSFTMKGFGTVVSGTLIAGRIRREDPIEILPGGQVTRVRGIQVHGVAVDEAVAGQRTALNLQRVELPDVQRGMVLAPPGVFSPTRIVDVHLELLRSAPGPILRRKRVRFHAGTAELMGYAVLLGPERLEPGASAFAQIHLERPTVVLPGDRFIVRQYSPMVTLGGGEILDAHPRRHRRADRGVPARLDQLRHGPTESRVMAIVRDAGPRAVDAAEIVRRLGLLHEEAGQHLRTLAQQDRVRLLADAPLSAVTAEVFDRAAGALLDEVRRFHEANPLLEGVGREDLKSRVRRLAPPALFRAAIDHLVGAGALAVTQDVVHLAGRAVTLGGDEARMRDELAGRFRDLGLQPPPPDDVIASLHMERQTARRILQLLMRDRVLVKINEELTVDGGAVRRLIDDVRAMKAGGARFGVKEFKELTGLSRKFAMPLLEYLDAQRVTRRVGDERIIL